MTRGASTTWRQGRGCGWPMWIPQTRIFRRASFIPVDRADRRTGQRRLPATGRATSAAARTNRPRNSSRPRQPGRSGADGEPRHGRNCRSSFLGFMILVSGERRMDRGVASGWSASSRWALTTDVPLGSVLATADMEREPRHGRSPRLGRCSSGWARFCFGPSCPRRCSAACRPGWQWLPGRA